MKILLMPNLDKENAALCVSRASAILHPMGCELLMHGRYKGSVDFEPITYSADFYELLAKCDLVISIGGDGTIIHSALHAAQAGKPLLGINAGRLGFTAGLELSELDKLRCLVTGEYKTERRMLLDVAVNSADGNELYSFNAVNDAVITRGSLSRILDMNVTYGSTMLNYRADGLIFATPTGSTAYSLSAGGPVVDPSLGCILLTPVCSHSLYARSVMFPENAVLRVDVAQPGNAFQSKPDFEAFMTIDGGKVVSVANGESVIISRSKLMAQFIIIDGYGFYDRLKHKFME